MCADARLGIGLRFGNSLGVGYVAFGAPQTPACSGDPRIALYVKTASLYPTHTAPRPRTICRATLPKASSIYPSRANISVS